MTRTRSILFTHVPRTAGSSVHYAFLRAMNWEDSFVVEAPSLLSRVREVLPAAPDDAAIYVGGHFSLRDVDAVLGIDQARSVNFVTVRDPLERLLSHHALIQSSAAAAPHAALHGVAIAEFLRRLRELDMLPMIDNPHCRTICGDPSFETAADAILRRYDFVATTERVTDLVDEVAHACGREWPNGAPSLPDEPHNSARRPEAGRPTEADLAGLQPFLAEDEKLVRWVRSRGGLISTARM